MITLGIHAASRDAAAALVADGCVVAAAEEERFTRRHSASLSPSRGAHLPHHAINFCLHHAGITLDDVDHLACSHDPDDPAGEAAPRGALQPHRGPLPPPWHRVDVTTCHQASAFLAAPFERCAVMTFGSRRGGAATGYGVFRDQHYQPLGQVGMPHSLGWLHERIAAHLGFARTGDEDATMMLAAQGRPRFSNRLRELIRIDGDGHYRITPFDPAEVIGPPRPRGAPLAQDHRDLAASLQDVLEDCVLRLAQWLRRASGESALALSGCLARNAALTARLRDLRLFDAVWVQPATGNAGAALGAALWVDARERCTADGAVAAAPGLPIAPRRWHMAHAYLGPAYSDDTIEALLGRTGVPYRRPDMLADAVAGLLAGNRIVGWFQDRMEFGPRALGGRSILASPIDPRMQARLNALKNREGFRPFAPALPVEDLPAWFWPEHANGGSSPFMGFTYNVQPLRDERIPSACHVDRTARVQTVDATTQPRFHALLKAFEGRTGVPLLLNTAFNVRGEPLVCTPHDALEAFLRMPLDALAIGSFLLEKPAAVTQRIWPV